MVLEIKNFSTGRIVDLKIVNGNMISIAADVKVISTDP